VFSCLKEIDPQARILLSSGYSLDGQALDIMCHGCLGFIQKPFNLKELALKLREVLDK
jgi:two-component system cell cycle sensor histidine kinase/response regulator CckA